MSTTREQLALWFDEGTKQGADYMIIVTDTFDWTDFPVYVTNGGEETVHQVAQGYENETSMSKVMEVYDLHGDKAEQVNANRTWAIPRPTPSPSTRFTEIVAARLQKLNVIR
jgi:hypothetical protein